MAIIHSNAPDSLELPGFNLPYDYTNDDYFASALNPQQNYQTPLTTLREFTMLRLMNELTDKPDWHKKVFDDEIADKWRKEALHTPDVDMTQEMVDWCIEELRYKARIFEKKGTVTVYNGDVVKSDVAVPEDLRNALIKAVVSLEDVHPSLRDWHPGSNGKVLDLVHPSLFPLVYGLTHFLHGKISLDDCIKRSGEGVTLDLCENKDPKLRQGRVNTKTPFSRKFQWLPCDVDISGDVPKITSYINNLHPQRDEELYRIIEGIIGHVIPLWNESLTRQKTGQYFIRVQYSDAVREEEESEPEQEEDEDDDDFDDRFQAWEDEYNDRKAAQPHIDAFQPPEPALFEEDGITLRPKYRVDLKREYGDRGIQVIVKLANIHLTPDKPEYEGGTWHIEGQLNEHICASALYYYFNDNITTSQLSFRQFVSGDTYDINYNQGYRRWIEDVFGCDSEGATIQDVGSVVTRQGRLITFPNILQHQVQPFRLADPTRPGHRKILALFLVEPNVRIISTANVPCQRLDWWRDAVNEDETGLRKLPLEVKDNIFSQVDMPFSMEHAKKLRLELMEERKQFVVQQDNIFKSQTFSLCEH